MREEFATKYHCEKISHPKRKKKITLKEFFEADTKCVIHCDTEEKANKLLASFNDLGETWNDGTSYLDENYWRKYKNKTCYFNNNFYDSINFAKNHNYKIYEFEDIIFPDKQEKPKWTFTEDEKVVLRMVDERFKWIARNKFGGIELFRYKPWKYGEMWITEFVAYDDLSVLKKFFKTIKWEDNEPCEFRKYIGE